MALLFLTRQWLPYEPVWRAFLSSVPPLGKGLHQGWQHLFSLHVHLPPNHFFNTDSIFTGTEVEERVAVEWGQWSVVSLLFSVYRRPYNKGPKQQHIVDEFASLCGPERNTISHRSAARLHSMLTKGLFPAWDLCVSLELHG